MADIVVQLSARAVHEWYDAVSAGCDGVDVRYATVGRRRFGAGDVCDVPFAARDAGGGTRDGAGVSSTPLSRTGGIPEERYWLATTAIQTRCDPRCIDEG